MKKFKLLNRSIFNNLIRTAGVSFVVIFLFSQLPPTLNFVKKNFFYKKSIISNAGINFDNLALENSLKEIRDSNNIDENKIHEKILADIEFYNTEKEIEEAPILNAKLIEKLFKDEGYSLKKVRQNKVVNIGISIPRLPKEIKNFQNVKKKKELFLEIVLPLILEENAKIRVDRIKFFSILNKKYNSKRDKEGWRFFGIQFSNNLN